MNMGRHVLAMERLLIILDRFLILPDYLMTHAQNFCLLLNGRRQTKSEVKFYFLFIEDLISCNRLSYSLFAGFNLTASFASINARWKSAFLYHTDALP